MSATVNITDMDGDSLISTNDTIVGSLIFRRSIGNGRTYVRGFEITGIIRSSLLSAFRTFLNRRPQPSRRPGNDNQCRGNGG